MFDSKANTSPLVVTIVVECFPAEMDLADLPPGRLMGETLNKGSEELQERTLPP